MILFCFQERLLTFVRDRRVFLALLCVLALIVYQIRVNRNSSQIKTLRIVCYGDSLTAGKYSDSQAWPYSISLKKTLEKSGFLISYFE